MKNQNLQMLIRELKKKSIEKRVQIWKRIATDLEKPTKKRRIVNLSKINKYCNNNEIIAVPGKVLSMGELTKKVTVAAYNFSSKAKDKINSSGSKAISLQELIEQNPKGQKVRIIG